jgi:peptide methionine sulfoxide reductase msrA/msrB
MKNILRTFLFLIIFSGRAEPVRLNELTPEEGRVIIEKGTEKPFSGKYAGLFESGIYACKRCGLGLYSSKNKFRSDCGWPSFDDEIEGAVERKADADGKRTEILCSRCGAHLGHVFKGEKLTEKNLRHCVNSISLDFIPENRIGKAFFAGGCFWGVEYYFMNEDGVILAIPGYMGGKGDNPTYKEVCSGKTGHAETVMIIFDKDKSDFEKLARIFFEIHDPAQKNRQGPDIGTQYRSAIFASDEEQKRTVLKLIEILKSKGLNVRTEVSESGSFFPAEEYHRKYYLKTEKKPYCHARVKRFD